MPKIVHRTCCGIDVHKSFVVACIAKTDENLVTTYSKFKRFSTFTGELRCLADWLADILKHDLIVESYIPPADIRQLRDLCRYRFKLTSYTTGEKNRAQNCLTVSNIKLDDVFPNYSLSHGCFKTLQSQSRIDDSWRCGEIPATN